jgi:ACS family hexuronate transporter-like MFS transporter
VSSLSARFPWRWAVFCFFALSSTLNFLDRQILVALIPELMVEFSLSAGDFGDVLFAFSATYALTAPLAGLLIDRLGLRFGSSLAVGLWSLTGMATALVNGMAGLVVVRALLGVTEAAGIPGTGKAAAIYLEPRQRALGSAVSQIGLTLGGVTAPLFAQWISSAYGWRAAFVAAGALGFVWIPAWLVLSRRATAHPAAAHHAPVSTRDVLRDRRYWALLAANMLLMSIYSLWVNWTTTFLVLAHGMPQAQANARLAWIPPIFASLGGLAGGWFSMRLASGTGGIVAARLRAIALGCLLMLANAAVAWTPSAGLATAIICLSYFACVLASVNLYALPLDLFGPERAAFCVAGLTSVYGVLQAVFSPIAGRVIDRYGFGPLCMVAALLPLAGYALLRLVLGRR